MHHPLSSLLIVIAILVAVFAVSASSAFQNGHQHHHHHHHHHHSGQKKMHLCGKRLATTISAMCTASSSTECPVKASEFEGSIIVKCCAGQCSMSDIRSYCCSMREAEAELQSQSNYLDFLAKERAEKLRKLEKEQETAEKSEEIAENEPNFEDSARHPKKIHHTEKHRYDVLNF